MKIKNSRLIVSDREYFESKKMGREFEAEASAPSVQDLEPSEAPPSYDQVIFGKNRTYKICQILESRFKVQKYSFYLNFVKSYSRKVFQDFCYENVDISNFI